MFPKLKQKKSFLLALVLLSALFVSACSGIESSNWPGLSADGDIVYVSYDGEVTALDTAEQSKVWSYVNTENSTAKFYAPVSIAGDQIIVGDNGVSAGIFAGGGFIVGIHALPVGSSGTPQPLWVSNEVVTGRVFAEALQVNEKIYFGTADNHFVALSKTDGSKIWDFRTENAIWSQPAYSNGIIYVSSLDKNVYALDSETGDVIWQAPLAGASASTPIVNEAANLLYVGSFDGLFHAFELDSGTESWSAETTDWIWGTAELYNDVVYFADMSGNVLAIDANNGEPVWAAQVPESSQAKPLVSQEKLFIASGDIDTKTGHLTAFTLNGEELWQQEVAGALSANPVDTEAGVVTAFIDVDQVLHVVVFNAETGDIEWSYTPAVAE